MSVIKIWDTTDTNTNIDTFVNVVGVMQINITSEINILKCRNSKWEFVFTEKKSGTNYCNKNL